LSPETQRRLSTLVLIASLGILIWLVLYAAYTGFYDWLDGQKPYLMSGRIAGFDIPPLTPTLTPLPTPAPSPTPTPLPEVQPLPAIRIIIPKIGVNAKIIEISIIQTGSGENTRYLWETPAYAVGHHEGSADPGEPGNIVLSGHNNTLGEVFRDLNQLEPGDEIYLYTLDKEFKYVVQAKDLVLAVGASEADRARHAAYVARTPDETLTLVSCWPYATYTHRIYVVAKPAK